MRPVLAFFLVILGLTAGATALAVKYSPETANYVAAMGAGIALVLLATLGGEVRTAARQLWRR